MRGPFRLALAAGRPQRRWSLRKRIPRPRPRSPRPEKSWWRQRLTRKSLSPRAIRVSPALIRGPPRPKTNLPPRETRAQKSPEKGTLHQKLRVFPHSQLTLRPHRHSPCLLAPARTRRGFPPQPRAPSRRQCRASRRPGGARHPRQWAPGPHLPAPPPLLTTPRPKKRLRLKTYPSARRSNPSPTRVQKPSLPATWRQKSWCACQMPHLRWCLPPLPVPQCPWPNRASQRLWQVEHQTQRQTNRGRWRPRRQVPSHRVHRCRAGQPPSPKRQPCGRSQCRPLQRPPPPHKQRPNQPPRSLRRQRRLPLHPASPHHRQQPARRMVRFAHPRFGAPRHLLKHPAKRQTLQRCGAVAHLRSHGKAQLRPLPPATPRPRPRPSRALCFLPGGPLRPRKCPFCPPSPRIVFRPRPQTVPRHRHGARQRARITSPAKWPTPCTPCPTARWRFRFHPKNWARCG